MQFQESLNPMILFFDPIIRWCSENWNKGFAYITELGGWLTQTKNELSLNGFSVPSNPMLLSCPFDLS